MDKPKFNGKTYKDPKSMAAAILGSHKSKKKADACRENFKKAREAKALKKEKK